MSTQTLCGGVRRRALRSIISAGTATVLAAGLAACGTTTSSATTSSSGPGAVSSVRKVPIAKVTVGFALSPPKAIFLAPYVARAEGFFAKERINAKFISMPNGLSTELGTTAGSINFGLSSATDAIESAAQHAPIHAIMSYGTKLDTECIGAPSIKQVKDLVGQPVGSTGTGGFSQTLLTACLRPGGVKASQVRPINMTRSEFVPALASGRIKAAVFHADDAYVVLHKVPGAHVLSKEYQSIPQWWYGGITTLDSFARSHTSAVERFLAALILANRWMNDPSHQAKLVSIGVSATHESNAAVSYAVKFLQKEKTWPTNCGLHPSQETYTARQLLKFKEISALPAYSKVVNSTYCAALKIVGSGV